MKNNEDSPEKKWTKSGELAKSGEWRRNPGRKEDAVEMIHNSWRGLFGTAFWLISVAELIFPNEATWQSGRPREPLSERTKYIWSPNKEAVAGVLIDKQCIEASKVEWNGNVGSTKWLWSMEGTSQEGWLSDDGEYFVGCYERPNLLPLTFTKDLVILSFFKHGKLIRSVRLNQLISDFSKLKRVGSQYRWSSYVGLNACGLIAAETVEGKRILFDIATGRPVKVKAEGVPLQSGWKTYRDILRCYQFQYPSQYLLKESVVLQGDQEGTPTGYVELGKDGKWFIEVAYEDCADFRQTCMGKSFEEFSVERAKTMYSADGPLGSTYATETTKKDRFTNPNKFEVMEIYLAVIHEEYFEDTEEPAIERRIEGPIYAILLGPTGESDPYRVLFFRIRAEDGRNSSQDRNRLKEIVDSVQALAVGM